VKFFSLFGSVILAIGIVGIYMLTAIESQSNSFVNYAEMEQSNLITKSWIPSFIPKSSYNIEEHHRVDQPYIFVSFNFNPKNIISFEQSCSLISANNYRCDNSGYPVSVVISNGNYAVIKSIASDT